MDIVYNFPNDFIFLQLHKLILDPLATYDTIAHYFRLHLVSDEYINYVETSTGSTLLITLSTTLEAPYNREERVRLILWLLDHGADGNIQNTISKKSMLHILFENLFHIDDFMLKFVYILMVKYSLLLTSLDLAHRTPITYFLSTKKQLNLHYTILLKILLEHTIEIVENIDVLGQLPLSYYLFANDHFQKITFPFNPNIFLDFIEFNKQNGDMKHATNSSDDEYVRNNRHALNDADLVYPIIDYYSPPRNFLTKVEEFSKVTEFELLFSNDCVIFTHLNKVLSNTKIINHLNQPNTSDYTWKYYALCLIFVQKETKDMCNTFLLSSHPYHHLYSLPHINPFFKFDDYEQDNDGPFYTILPVPSHALFTITSSINILSCDDKNADDVPNNILSPTLPSIDMLKCLAVFEPNLLFDVFNHIILMLKAHQYLTIKHVNIIKFLLLLRKDHCNELSIFHLSEILSVLFQNSFTIPNAKTYYLLSNIFNNPAKYPHIYINPDHTTWSDAFIADKTAPYVDLFNFIMVLIENAFYSQHQKLRNSTVNKFTHQDTTLLVNHLLAMSSLEPTALHYKQRLIIHNTILTYTPTKNPYANYGYITSQLSKFLEEFRIKQRQVPDELNTSYFTIKTSILDSFYFLNAVFTQEPPSHRHRLERFAKISSSDSSSESDLSVNSENSSENSDKSDEEDVSRSSSVWASVSRALSQNSGLDTESSSFSSDSSTHNSSGSDSSNSDSDSDSDSDSSSDSSDSDSETEEEFTVRITKLDLFYYNTSFDRIVTQIKTIGTDLKIPSDMIKRFARDVFTYVIANNIWPNDIDVTNRFITAPIETQNETNKKKGPPQKKNIPVNPIQSSMKLFTPAHLLSYYPTTNEHEQELCQIQESSQDNNHIIPLNSHHLLFSIPESFFIPFIESRYYENAITIISDALSCSISTSHQKQHFYQNFFLQRLKNQYTTYTARDESYLFSPQHLCTDLSFTLMSSVFIPIDYASLFRNLRTALLSSTPAQAIMMWQCIFQLTSLDQVDMLLKYQKAVNASHEPVQFSNKDNTTPLSSPFEMLDPVGAKFSSILGSLSTTCLLDHDAYNNSSIENPETIIKSGPILPMTSETDLYAANSASSATIDLLHDKLGGDIPLKSLFVSLPSYSILSSPLASLSVSYQCLSQAYTAEKEIFEQVASELTLPFNLELLFPHHSKESILPTLTYGYSQELAQYIGIDKELHDQRYDLSLKYHYCYDFVNNIINTIYDERKSILDAESPPKHHRIRHSHPNDTLRRSALQHQLSLLTTQFDISIQYDLFNTLYQRHIESDHQFLLSLSPYQDPPRMPKNSIYHYPLPFIQFLFLFSPHNYDDYSCLKEIMDFYTRIYSISSRGEKFHSALAAYVFLYINSKRTSFDENRQHTKVANIMNIIRIPELNRSALNHRKLGNFYHKCSNSFTIESWFALPRYSTLKWMVDHIATSTSIITEMVNGYYPDGSASPNQMHSIWELLLRFGQFHNMSDQQCEELFHYLTAGLGLSPRADPSSTRASYFRHHIAAVELKHKDFFCERDYFLTDRLRVNSPGYIPIGFVYDPSSNHQYWPGLIATTDEEADATLAIAKEDYQNFCSNRDIYPPKVPELKEEGGDYMDLFIQEYNDRKIWNSLLYWAVVSQESSLIINAGKLFLWTSRAYWYLNETYRNDILKDFEFMMKNAILVDVNSNNPEKSGHLTDRFEPLVDKNGDRIIPPGYDLIMIRDFFNKYSEFVTFVNECYIYHCSSWRNQCYLSDFALQRNGLLKILDVWGYTAFGSNHNSPKFTPLHNVGLKSLHFGSHCTPSSRSYNDDTEVYYHVGFKQVTSGPVPNKYTILYLTELYADPHTKFPSSYFSEENTSIRKRDGCTGFYNSNFYFSPTDNPHSRISMAHHHTHFLSHEAREHRAFESFLDTRTYAFYGSVPPIQELQYVDPKTNKLSTIKVQNHLTDTAVPKQVLDHIHFDPLLYQTKCSLDSLTYIDEKNMSFREYAAQWESEMLSSLHDLKTFSPSKHTLDRVCLAPSPSNLGGTVIIPATATTPALLAPKPLQIDFFQMNRVDLNKMYSILSTTSEERHIGYQHALASDYTLIHSCEQFDQFVQTYASTILYNLLQYDLSTLPLLNIHVSCSCSSSVQSTLQKCTFCIESQENISMSPLTATKRINPTHLNTLILLFFKHIVPVIFSRTHNFIPMKRLSVNKGSSWGDFKPLLWTSSGTEVGDSANLIPPQLWLFPHLNTFESDTIQYNETGQLSEDQEKILTEAAQIKETAALVTALLFTTLRVPIEIETSVNVLIKLQMSFQLETEHPVLENYATHIKIPLSLQDDDDDDDNGDDENSEENDDDLDENINEVELSDNYDPDNISDDTSEDNPDNIPIINQSTYLAFAGGDDEFDNQMTSPVQLITSILQQEIIVRAIVELFTFVYGLNLFTNIPQTSTYRGFPMRHQTYLIMPSSSPQFSQSDPFSLSSDSYFAYQNFYNFSPYLFHTEFDATTTLHSQKLFRVVKIAIPYLSQILRENLIQQLLDLMSRAVTYHYTTPSLFKSSEIYEIISDLRSLTDTNPTSNVDIESLLQLIEQQNQYHNFTSTLHLHGCQDINLYGAYYYGLLPNNFPIQQHHTLISHLMIQNSAYFNRMVENALFSTKFHIFMGSTNSSPIGSHQRLAALHNDINSLSSGHKVDDKNQTPWFNPIESIIQFISTKIPFNTSQLINNDSSSPNISMKLFTAFIKELFFTMNPLPSPSATTFTHLIPLNPKTVNATMTKVTWPYELPTQRDLTQVYSLSREHMPWGISSMGSGQYQQLSCDNLLHLSLNPAVNSHIMRIFTHYVLPSYTTSANPFYDDKAIIQSSASNNCHGNGKTHQLTKYEQFSRLPDVFKTYHFHTETHHDEHHSTDHFVLVHHIPDLSPSKLSSISSSSSFGLESSITSHPGHISLFPAARSTTCFLPRTHSTVYDELEYRQMADKVTSNTQYTFFSTEDRFAYKKFEAFVMAPIINTHDLTLNAHKRTLLIPSNQKIIEKDRDETEMDPINWSTRDVHDKLLAGLFNLILSYIFTKPSTSSLQISQLSAYLSLAGQYLPPSLLQTAIPCDDSGHINVIRYLAALTPTYYNKALLSTLIYKAQLNIQALDDPLSYFVTPTDILTTLITNFQTSVHWMDQLLTFLQAGGQFIDRHIVNLRTSSSFMAMKKAAYNVAASSNKSSIVNMLAIRPNEADSKQAYTVWKIIHFYLSIKLTPRNQFQTPIEALCNHPVVEIASLFRALCEHVAYDSSQQLTTTVSSMSLFSDESVGNAITLHKCLDALDTIARRYNYNLELYNRYALAIFDEKQKSDENVEDNDHDAVCIEQIDILFLNKWSYFIEYVVPHLDLFPNFLPSQYLQCICPISGIYNFDVETDSYHPEDKLKQIPAQCPHCAYHNIATALSDSNGPTLADIHQDYVHTIGEMLTPLDQSVFVPNTPNLIPSCVNDASADSIVTEFNKQPLHKQTKEVNPMDCHEYQNPFEHLSDFKNELLHQQFKEISLTSTANYFPTIHTKYKKFSKETLSPCLLSTISNDSTNIIIPDHQATTEHHDDGKYTILYHLHTADSSITTELSDLNKTYDCYNIKSFYEKNRFSPLFDNYRMQEDYVLPPQVKLWLKSLGAGAYYLGITDPTREHNFGLPLTAYDEPPALRNISAYLKNTTYLNSFIQHWYRRLTPSFTHGLMWYLFTTTTVSLDDFVSLFGNSSIGLMSHNTGLTVNPRKQTLLHVALAFNYNESMLLAIWRHMTESPYPYDQHDLSGDIQKDILFHQDAIGYTIRDYFSLCNTARTAPSFVDMISSLYAQY